MINKLEAAMRLVNAACGEPYGDGELVTDIGVGYASGYSDTVWVLGNWNPKRFPRNGEPPLTKEENIGPRLFDALERIGVEGEWLDEWQRCDNCQKLIRTEPDSYSWQPEYVHLEDGETLCATCAVDENWIADVLESFINNPDRVVTFMSETQLAQLDWERVNDHPFENGWHPGQTDNPREILRNVQREFGSRDVLFLLDEASQFFIRFSVFVKERTCDDCGNKVSDGHVEGCPTLEDVAPVDPSGYYGFIEPKF